MSKDLFIYNPFGGTFKEDLGETIVPKFNVDKLVHKIIQEKSIKVEFVGKKGRGKTTHLYFLHNLLPDLSLYELNSKSNLSEILCDQSPIVLIDGIHHLNFFARVKLFRSKKTLVYTTHRTRKLNCFLAGTKLISLKFKGINKNQLSEILNKRLELASECGVDEVDRIDEVDAENLIRKFGDNYRAIINHLYHLYQ